MHTAQFLNLLVHIGFGGIGLVLGLIPLLSTKGGLQHRRWGRRFALLAAFVIGSGGMTLVLGHHSSLSAVQALVLVMFYEFVSGLRALKLRSHGPLWPDALFAISALAACVLVLANTEMSARAAIVTLPSLGMLAFVASYDLSRHWWPVFWLRAARPLDPGLKMTAVFFGMLSAGAGNLLVSLQPWSIVIPNIMGTLAIFTLTIAYVVQFRRRAKGQDILADSGPVSA
ncbi:hypothetical protein [Rugamonas aquatica]|uniref:DUF2306 domain-containing protein n=1 Tax=Rugamonas aquatica TaxID=2743357 RepID=A0A6A7NAN8_9BURK|nr:hypothetical protein [Rugamonas aquatica]MQA42018.1 hypothetical protein [Rugamonas aquatica]